MKTISKIAALAAAVMLLPVSCSVETEKEKADSSKIKSVHFLDGSFRRNENTRQKVEKKEKAPCFNQFKAKRAINLYEKLNGKPCATYNLEVGTFEASKSDMDLYATLATNGLVNVKNKAIYDKKFNRYSDWITVSLTEKGQKYLHKNIVVDNTIPLDKESFDPLYFHPATDIDEYGRVYEDPAIDSSVRILLDNFYDAYLADEPKAISEYCDKEFIEAYNRLAKISELKAELNMPTLLKDHAFTTGTKRGSVDFTYYKVNKYKNTYRVVFKSGKSALLILSPRNNKIFDLVFNAGTNSTVRTENASFKEADIEALEKSVNELKKKTAAPKTVKTEDRKWNAPGLELAIVDGPTEYEMATKTNQSTYVKIDLYHYNIEKVYKVIPSDDFNNEATVVLKKAGITPFQFILQKFEKVDPVCDDNLYETGNCEFKYYKDCGWVVVE